MAFRNNLIYIYCLLVIADPCICNPCSHGGVCRSSASGSYTCDCSGVTGWTGSLCDDNINECISGSPNNHQCQHGGVCQDTPGGYTCDCSAIDYTGDRCQTGMIK